MTKTKTDRRRMTSTDRALTRSGFEKKRVTVPTTAPTVVYIARTRRGDILDVFANLTNAQTHCDDWNAAHDTYDEQGLWAFVARKTVKPLSTTFAPITEE